MTSIVNTSNHTEYVSLSNQECTTQLTLINLHLNEYTQELRFYPSGVNLDGCFRSCYTLNDRPNKLCLQNETEDLNLSGFNKEQTNRKH